MTTQLDLFGDPIAEPEEMMCCPHCRGRGVISTSEATSRTSDGSTARNAGDQHSGDSRRFRANSRQALILRSLSYTSQTAQEVARSVMGEDAPLSALEGARRRVSSLKRIGLITDSGQERHNPGSTSASVVWTITADGLETLRTLDLTGWSYPGIS